MVDQIVAFKTKDGKIFKNYKEAEEHEKELTIKQHIHNWANLHLAFMFNFSFVGEHDMVKPSDFAMQELFNSVKQAIILNYDELVKGE